MIDRSVLQVARSFEAHAWSACEHKEEADLRGQRVDGIGSAFKEDLARQQDGQASRVTSGIWASHKLGP